MNASSSRPDAMISRPIAFARAMSDPTSRPSHTSAHSALEVRRGSIAYSRAPLRTPRRRWWKKIVCVSRALLPHRTIRSVSSASRYELVPPPAPNTVARPTTLGACQVRLQLSTLFVSRTTRANFCVAKFSSFVALEQLKTPVSAPASIASRKPDAARSSASFQLAARSPPPSRTSGVVSLSYFIAMRRNLDLEEPDRRSVLVDVDRVGGRCASVARHRLHVAAERDEPARARVRADVAHRHCEAGRRVGQRRVVREREVGLRHADREIGEADALELGNLLARGGLEEDPVATVDTRHYRLDLSLDRLVERIDGREIGRLLRGGDHGFGERRSAFAPVDHRLVPLGREGAVCERDLADLLNLLVSVSRETVDGDHGVETEPADGREVADHVGRAGRNRLRPALGIAAVVLERLHRRHENDGARRQLADSADDVEELLHPHVGAEARLGDDDVAELERDAVGDERVVAVRNVRERAAVDERRLTLERLNEVRLDRLLEEDGHRTRGLQLLGGHRLALVRRADRDRAEPRAQVEEIERVRGGRHHLGRRGDVEAGLAGVAVRATAEADRDVPQGAVVDVDAAPPRDRERVDAELVAVEQMSLEHRREQVV